MVIPYIGFHGECREALEFYQEVFQCSLKMAQPYGEYVPEGLEEIPPDLEQWILHAELELCGGILWFADEAVQPKSSGNPVKITVTVCTKEEATAIYERFEECARDIYLPPTETFYSTFHAELIDKYGIGWDIVAEEAPIRCEEETI